MLPMTLQEFYDRIGGDYKATISRLPSEALIKKFVLKYPGDPSFNQLKDALAAQDWELAFRASHTLKGVAANLAFTELMERVSELTEQLRPCTQPADEAMYQSVVESYERTVGAIEAYRKEM